MKVAIFNHPFTDFYHSPQRMVTANLDYLGKIIFPHEYLCFDVVKKLKKSIPLPKQLKYLKNYLVYDQSHYSFFHNYYQYGEVNHFSHKRFEQFCPEVIIITSFAYCYFQGLKNMITYLRKKFSVPVIIGGNGPSAHPLYYFDNSGADYVVVGPAEISLKTLLDHLQKGEMNIQIPNVYSQQRDHSIVMNQSYPFEPFFNIKKKNIQLQITRGCPKNCTYCSVKLVSGQYFLKTSLIKLEAAIADLPPAIKHFNFEDDNLTFYKDYCQDVIQIIKKYYPQSTFSFENGLDFTTLTPEFVDFLVSQGLKQWNISLTSINLEILNQTKRNYQKQTFLNVLKEMEKSRLLIIVYFICGLPEDNSENILKTLYFLTEQPVLLGISPFYLVPGIKIESSTTEKLKQLKEENLESDLAIYYKATSFYPWGKINSEKLVTFFMLSRFINAVKRYTEVDWFEWKDMLAGKTAISKEKGVDFRTQSGIISSFCQKRILYLDKNNQYQAYPLDSIILNNFFHQFEQGLTIRNQGFCFTDDFLQRKLKIDSRTIKEATN
ncbi:MAG: radical SAM protein [Spirochaetes bacterium]|nr:radical SAM protein [Spirochaetota bacterium]